MICKNRFLAGAFVAATLAMPISSAFAQDMAPAADMKPMTEMSPAASAVAAAMRANYDRVFVAKAMQGNMAEIATGQLALKKSKNAQVKMLAQHLITGHSAANADLMRVAASIGVKPPAMVSAMQKSTADNLSKMSGDRFDKMFMDAQIEAHENAITMYQHESEIGSNAEVKAYVARTLPAILDHTAMIFAVARNVGAPALADRPQELVLAAADAGNMAMQKMMPMKGDMKDMKPMPSDLTPMPTTR